MAMEDGSYQANGLLVSLAIALGLGMLVGLQREWVHKRVAGIRTFPLVALFGGLSAVAGESFGGWVIAAGLLGCVALLIPANLTQVGADGERDGGITTEFALLVTYLIGVAVVLGYRIEATVCAGTMLVLLQEKSRLHDWVGRFGEGELRALSRLVLLGLVILPLLPNRDMGYLGVINPFRIWLMVVLIVGISLAAYLAAKFIGGSRGVVLSGILGGMISSTATTAGIARRSKSAPASSRACALIVMIAAATVFVRVMVEIAVVAGGAGRPMLGPFAVLLGWALVVSWILGRFVKTREEDSDRQEVPSEFKAAVIFALLYVGVLLAVAYAREHLGSAGLHAVAAVSGLTDMDAITLSTSELVAKGHLAADQGWRVILLGGMANMLFKAGMVAVLAHRSMFWPVLAAFGATGAGAAAVWIWWPW
jgi:uncharacterized membrane protein (DUF4010 family)